MGRKRSELLHFTQSSHFRTFFAQRSTYSTEERRAAGRLLRQSLLPVVRGPELAVFLGLSSRALADVLRHPTRYYRTFSIRKKSGGRRQICAPDGVLTTIQRAIHRRILDQVPVHRAAYAYVSGRSMMNCAAPHKGKQYLWNIDLLDFFVHVGTARVTALFEGIGYPAAAASYLAELCTLRNQLPQGAPTSPALSNLVLRPVDQQLSTLCRKNKVTYTRYADDLNFSAMQPIKEEFRATVEAILGEQGFRINPLKNWYVGPGGQRKVVGLVINKGVSVPRKLRRRIRAICHRFSQNPDGLADQYQSLTGLINWVRQFHKKEGNSYLRLLRESMTKPNTAPLRAPKSRGRAK